MTKAPLAAPAADAGGAPLHVGLFGPFVAMAHGSPLPPLRTRKGQWLLALLVLKQARPVDRAWLAATLWPDTPEKQAFANLRKSLSDLRRALGAQAYRLFASTPRGLGLDLSGAEVDVLAFDNAIARGEESAFREAVSLYRGPLLEGCNEEWVLQERAEREQKYLGALANLAEHAAERAEYSRAADYLRLLVAVDPLRECDQRQLMRMLASCGDYSAAVQVYRDLRLLLRTQLNTEPDPDTQCTFDEIRAHAQLRQQPIAPAVAARGAPVRAERSNLPHPLTKLVGRDSELEEITSRLMSARLLTLTGPGGVGKTRLAIEAARSLSAAFVDGVHFVELAPLTEPDLVPQSLASIFDVREGAGQSILEAVTRALEPRQMLILLDNCEHLIDACAHTAESLLARCPDLRILATSRQSLGVIGEVDWRVPPLSLPPAHAAEAGLHHADWNPESVAKSDAVRLFIERAFAARTGFALTGDTAPRVAAICHRLDGIPLAIELAAAQAKHLTLDDIDARLTASLQTLASGSRTAQPRQQTLQATMEWSYNLLDELEKMLLQKLSVFSGVFGIEAVRAVCCDRELPVSSAEALLRSLVDKSLVTLVGMEGPSRYRLLETTRGFARSIVHDTPDERLLWIRHAEHVLTVVERAQVLQARDEEPSALALIDEVANDLRSALEHITQAGQDRSMVERTVRCAEVLSAYWVTRGRASEGLQWITRLVDRIPERTSLRADALLRRSYMAICCVDGVRASQAAAEEARAVFEEIGDVSGAARAMVMVGGALTHAHDVAAAVTVLAGALDIYRDLGDLRGQARVMTFLGVTHYAMGDVAEARKYHEASLAISLQFGTERQTYWSLDNVGDVALAQGSLQEAASLYRRSLEGFAALGDLTGILECLRGIGELCVARGDIAAMQRAAALFGAVRELRVGVGTMPWMFEEGHRVAVERACDALGDSDYTAAFADGQAMSIDEAIALARDSL